MMVFVYGTLKSGHYNHRCISIDASNKRIFDDAYVLGEMFDLGAFPAITKGNKPIFGEVWDVSPETLKRLDHLEGHPDHYIRVKVPLLGDAKETVWAYVMPKERLPQRAVPMPVGNWPMRR